MPLVKKKDGPYNPYVTRKNIHKMFRLIFIDFFFNGKSYYIFIGRTLIHFHENLHV